MSICTIVWICVHQCESHWQWTEAKSVTLCDLHSCTLSPWQQQSSVNSTPSPLYRNGGVHRRSVKCTKYTTLDDCNCLAALGNSIRCTWQRKDVWWGEMMKTGEKQWNSPLWDTGSCWAEGRERGRICAQQKRQHHSRPQPIYAWF